jgi:hypothetical protein
MSKHCFLIPQDATVRLSGLAEGADSNAFDELSKAVSMSQGSMRVIPGEPVECTVEIPDDDAAQSAFKLMASEVLQKFEFTCPK